MIEMVNYRNEAVTLFNKKVYEEFMEKVKAFEKKLALTDFDKKTKAEYLEIVEECYFHYARARQLEAEYGELSRESDKYNKLYREAPTDQKAEEYKKKFYEIQGRMVRIESHHELAKQDMQMCQPNAQRVNIAVEDRIVELQENRGKTGPGPSNKNGSGKSLAEMANQRRNAKKK